MYLSFNLELLKKDKFKEAGELFKKIIDDAKSINSKTYQLKSMCGLFLIECKQNTPSVVKELEEILGVINSVTKKEKEDTIKLLVDDVGIERCRL